ncbi:MAG: hypothetical protein KZY73_03060 [Bacillaceae bacterium]|uniref:hypothetical protein n=1 Tax=Bacillus safensis TaxID=561879 RepID=UPI001D196428|nr:hypothetical protein [Bacillus safensis]MBW4850958.1 hypothetical protein [Bacillaceae bacterium]MBW4851751.1 hypothetical protein [Bacillaceae bacterium]MBW4855946.1 hypothetical protein [Bacillaceae bacterium]
MQKLLNIVEQRPILNQYAKLKKVKFSMRDVNEIIEELSKEGCRDDLEYLNEQFKFSSKHLTLCELEENFPETSNTPEKLLKFLIQNRGLKTNQIDTEWEPTLRPNLQLCAIKHEGSAVYLKFVEEKRTTRKKGYDSITIPYAHFISIVLIFGDKPLLQMRCAFTDIKKYRKQVLEFIGYSKDCEHFTVPKLTKKNAKRMCEHLSAGVSSSHISLPTSVGSIQFNGKRGVDLNNDHTFSALTSAIKNLGYPTDHKMDEKCNFKYTDPRTAVEIETVFEVNYGKGYFKFTKEVPESVVDHVLDVLVKVDMEDKQEIHKKEVAATQEEV